MIIPALSEVLCQPGMMVGVGLGMCIGFFARGSFLSDNGNPEDMMDSGGGGTDDSDDEGWDEDGFLAEGSGEMKLVLVVRTDLKMGKGKAAAQCSHATLKAYKQLQKRNKNLLKAWEMNGQPKVVVKIDDEASLMDLSALAREAGLTVSVIQDAGRTQIAPGSRTVVGIGPGPVDVIDELPYLMAHKMHLFSKKEAQKITLRPMRPRFSIKMMVGGKSMTTEGQQSPDVFAYLSKVMIGTTPQNNLFFQSTNI